MSLNVRATRPVLSYRSLVWNFAQRDLKARFKGTALGWSWSLVLPLATLLVYSVVFAVIFRAVPPDFGNGKSGNFTVWLLAGLVPWTLFSSGINSAISSLLSTGQLLKKIFFPAFAPILGGVLSVGVQSAIELGILAVVLIAFLNIGWTWLLVPIWAALFVAFTAALATALSVLNAYYRDIAHIVVVALQLLFYITPIIYPITFVPEEWRGFPLRTLVELNPLSAFVELFRSLMYGLSPGTPFLWGVSLGWTVAAVLLGLWVYRRKAQDLGEEL